MICTSLVISTDSVRTDILEKCLLSQGFQHDIAAGDNLALTGPGSERSFDETPDQQSAERAELAGGGYPQLGHSPLGGGSRDQRATEATICGEAPTRPSHSSSVHIGDGGIRGGPEAERDEE